MDTETEPTGTEPTDKIEKLRKRPPRAVPKKRSPLKTLFRILVWLSIFGVFCAVMAVAGVYYTLSSDLPKINTLADYRPPIITTVYSNEGRKIAEFSRERRIVIPLSKMPDLLKQAFIAAEDSRFYRHKGIDLPSIVRAFFKNIEAGAIVQGGSTITQQVTRSFFLSPEKSYRRKIREAILAYRIDKTFTKDDILFLYLNQIYLGHGAYGVQAAAGNYFEKSAENLDLAECAMLAGLPQAPSRYSPFRHPERAKERQIYVLNRMVEEKFITRQQAEAAIHTLLDIKPRRNWYMEEVPFYTEHVRRYVEEKYGKNTLYEQGLVIHTAVDIDMQKAAREEINKGLSDLDKRQGYRGPLKHLAPEAIESFSNQLQDAWENDPPEPGTIVKGVVVAVDDGKKMVTVRLGSQRGTIGIKSMKWARKPNPEIAHYQSGIKRPGQALKVGDVILVKIHEKKENTDNWPLTLEQVPRAQAALLCIESETGYVKAMVGGRSFEDTQFNRAIQSRRQPGSAFKPIIYAAAIDKGYTPATVIIDSPVIARDLQRDFTWKPKNYSRKFYGPTLFRTALVKSRNVVTIKILKDIGVGYAIGYARRLGIESDLSRNLSIALGSSGVSLLEIVRAYSVFNHMGDLLTPLFITRIVDRDGNVLEEAIQDRVQVIEQDTAYIMTSLLESVVKEGTGRRVRALNRPVAGKTGTTNNLYDAWFLGFTPEYTTGVWVGFDEGGPLGKGETGSRAASPIWLGFMKKILDGQPVRVFKVPEAVVFAKIDADTGLLPITESKKVLFECFKEGTVPTRHTKKPNAISETDDFFKSIM